MKMIPTFSEVMVCSLHSHLFPGLSQFPFCLNALFLSCPRCRNVYMKGTADMQWPAVL